MACLDINNSTLIGRCSFCTKHVMKNSSKNCEHCDIVTYCSEKCKYADWDNDQNCDYAHKLWCDKLTSFKVEENKMKDFPFTFTEETTSCNFDDQIYAAFLTKRGIFGHGMWRRENFLWLSPLSLDPIPLPGQLTTQEDPFVLPKEGDILESESPSLDAETVLSNWEEYYNWRGFDFDSPITILLQWPLTLYYIVSKLLKEDYASIHDRIFKSRKMFVHIIGVEKEVELIPAFQELSNLLPDVEISLLMIGRNIHQSSALQTSVKGTMRITIIRGTYHTHKPGADDAQPDFIVGFNAGLAAYLSWPATLQFLKKLKNPPPTYFTDYCRYSSECSNIVLHRLGIGEISNVHINPFRSPVRTVSDANNFAWFSNAFVFRVNYL